MDGQNTPKDFPEERKLRGLYRHVKISVKTLDRIILVGIAAIVLVLIFAVSHSGYTVTFDSKGGTDVASQELRYGDVIQEPEAPTREGYTFDGWYADENLGTLWDFGTAVEGSMTLYAGWMQNP
jgi:uncharacterized repeat protein (TIGR02543 family)